MAAPAVPMDVTPYRLSGTVYGVLLNHASALAELGSAIHEAPYKAAPKAPVLYVKPRNTLSTDGASVTVPAGTDELEIAAQLGVVIGRTACHLDAAHAIDHVAGYLIVNDVSVPHRPYYRPSIRFKARDGFCPLGPRVVPRAAIASPDALEIQVHVDGKLRQNATTAELIRSVATLLADITEFMTLAPGDVLAVGAAGSAPRVRAGQEVVINIPGIGQLRNRIVGAAT